MRVVVADDAVLFRERLSRVLTEAGSTSRRHDETASSADAKSAFDQAVCGWS